MLNPLALVGCAQGASCQLDPSMTPIRSIRGSTQAVPPGHWDYVIDRRGNPIGNDEYVQPGLFQRLAMRMRGQ